MGRRTVGTDFGLFWSKVEGTPSWVALERAGRSPTGVPDDYRKPIRKKNLLEMAIENPVPDKAGHDALKLMVTLCLASLFGFIVLGALLVWQGATPLAQAGILSFFGPVLPYLEVLLLVFSVMLGAVITFWAFKRRKK